MKRLESKFRKTDPKCNRFPPDPFLDWSGYQQLYDDTACTLCHNDCKFRYVYNLSLLQKATDSDGNDIDMGADFGPTVNSEMDVDSNIWDLVHEGMRKVISVSNATIFPESWPVELSGKTGTAPGRPYTCKPWTVYRLLSL